MLDLLDVDASSQSTHSSVEAEAENELLDLPITVTKKGRTRNVLEDEMVISNRDYHARSSERDKSEGILGILSGGMTILLRAKDPA